MKRASRTIALCTLAASVLVGAAPHGTTSASARRDDYADRRFTDALDAGLEHFYAQRFGDARADFNRALSAVPDNTLAITFADAAVAHEPGELQGATDAAEDAVAAAPSDYVAHVRLGFAYLFESVAGLERREDARQEFETAVRLQPHMAGAHVGLGIMRFDERSPHRAKLEFLQALRADANDVLAREYLGQLYQSDLHDPARGLEYLIDVPNLVPQYADIDFHIGSLLCDLHQSDAAIAYLQRGIDLDVAHVGEAGRHGYTLIARIDMSEHRYAAATKILQAALAADVDTVYARTLLAQIRNVAASPAPK